MTSIKRRTFLGRSFAAAGAIGLSSFSSNTQTFAGEGVAQSRRPNPIAVSTYSFWRFKRNLKLPIETCIDEAGFEWVIDSIEKCLPAAEKWGSNLTERLDLQVVSRTVRIRGDYHQKLYQGKCH